MEDYNVGPMSAQCLPNVFPKSAQILPNVPYVYPMSPYSAHIICGQISDFFRYLFKKYGLG